MTRPEQDHSSSSLVTGMTRPEQDHSSSGNRTQVCRSRGGRLYQQASKHTFNKHALRTIGAGEKLGLLYRLGLSHTPGAGIMEADNRQVTTVFTVQPSFMILGLSSADGGMTVGL